MHQPERQQWLDQTEIEAIEASLPDVGAAVAELGPDRPPATWQRDEVLRLILTAVKAYERHRQEIIAREEIPF